jgi:hypothetical protein
MIQKEAMVEQYWVKFNEDGKMKLKLDDVKSDTDIWPTADWTYDEDRVIRIGYKKARPEINKITVFGKITQSRVGVVTDDGWETYSFSYAEGEPIVLNQTYDKFTIRYDAPRVRIASTGNFKISNVTLTTTGGLIKYATSNFNYFPYYFISYYFRRTLPNGLLPAACGFNIAIKTAETEVSYKTRYDQISATVTDPNSIAKYGELDGGTIEYPLLETTEQCENVGSRIIRDSHRQIGQVNFQIPFNPLVQTGQTISITDSKIGLTECYFVEGVNHDINISPDGKVKARTGIEGVLYV